MWEVHTEQLIVQITDTNILIKHLALLGSLVALLLDTKADDWIRPTLVVPRIVLQELDGLKNSERIVEPVGSPSKPGESTHSRPQPSKTNISTQSRAATSWLLSVMPSPDAPKQLSESPVVRGQRRHETLFTEEERQRRGDNDNHLLDACLFFRRTGLQEEVPPRVVLLSDDKNLCLRGRIEEILAFGVGEVPSAIELLHRLDPTFAAAIKPSPSPSTPRFPLPRSTSNPQLPDALIQTPRSPPNTHPHYSIHSPPISRKRPPVQQPPLPPPPTEPSARESFDNPMELDEDRSYPRLPPLDPLPIPQLYPIHNPSHVFGNISLLVGYFLALPLYRYLLRHLREIRPDPGVWQEDLGDWRVWDGGTCIRVVRTWWQDGDLDKLCSEALKKINNRPDTSRPLRPEPPLSRNSKPPSLGKQLSDLHQSLPALITHLSTPMENTASWSSPRFEVLLEELQLCLSVLLVGLMGDVAVNQEVGALILSWVKDLRKLGMKLEPPKLS